MGISVEAAMREARHFPYAVARNKLQCAREGLCGNRTRGARGAVSVAGIAANTSEISRRRRGVLTKYWAETPYILRIAPQRRPDGSLQGRALQVEEASSSGYSLRYSLATLAAGGRSAYSGAGLPQVVLALHRRGAEDS